MIPIGLRPRHGWEDELEHVEDGGLVVDGIGSEVDQLTSLVQSPGTALLEQLVYFCMHIVKDKMKIRSNQCPSKNPKNPATVGWVGRV